MEGRNSNEKMKKCKEIEIIFDRGTRVEKCGAGRMEKERRKTCRKESERGGMQRWLAGKQTI